MKHAYSWARPLLAALLLCTTLGAKAQQAWRPFRPGLIYAFSGPGSTSAHTLRIDSAHVTAAGDSAWLFKRIAKLSNGTEQSIYPYGIYRKSHNNLFGAKMTWKRASSAFILENVAEGNMQAAISLQLRPQAAVGSTWTASVAPAITATLTSRTEEQVGVGLDSVAVITLSSGQVVQLSRSYGLLQGPQWLGTAIGTAQWSQARMPMTLAQSPYNPTALFNLQPGDEMGYFEEPFTISPFPSFESYILRRILTRQQTPDSLVYTYQEQTRSQTFVTPTGGTAGTQTYPVQTKRWAFSLRTGKSNQFRAMSLLTGEFAPVYASAQPPLLVGRGIIASAGSNSNCAPNGQYVNFIEIFPGFNAPQGQYSTGIDIGWRQEFSVPLGLGDVFTADTHLIYYRRTLNGTTTTCGSPLAFATLLPNRTAAAALATLAPNPAAEAATLTLAVPARPGTRMYLTDAMGRTVWSAPVPAGQTATNVPLAGRPAGLYLLHLSGPDAEAATWKVVHE